MKENRSRLVTVRFRPREAEGIAARADAEGVSLSEYIQQAVLEKFDRVKYPFIGYGEIIGRVRVLRRHTDEFLKGMGTE